MWKRAADASSVVNESAIPFGHLAAAISVDRNLVTRWALGWMPILGANQLHHRAGNAHGNLRGNLVRSLMVHLQFRHKENLEKPFVSQVLVHHGIASWGELHFSVGGMLQQAFFGKPPNGLRRGRWGQRAQLRYSTRSRPIAKGFPMLPHGMQNPFAHDECFFRLLKRISPPETRPLLPFYCSGAPPEKPQGL
jgi:hypothetical protein